MVGIPGGVRFSMGAARTQEESSKVPKRESESMMGGEIQLDWLELLMRDEDIPVEVVEGSNHLISIPYIHTSTHPTIYLSILNFSYHASIYPSTSHYHPYLSIREDLPLSISPGYLTANKRSSLLHAHPPTLGTPFQPSECSGSPTNRLSHNLLRHSMGI